MKALWPRICQFSARFGFRPGRFAAGRAFMIGCLLTVPHVSCGTTVITNTRAEIAFMAGLWEADSAQISSLANAQLPKFSNDWQYIFPSGGISADGDLHIAIAVDGSGYGSTNGNTGTSPIIAEVVNVTAAQFAALRALKGVQAKPRGIFRFYTEHIAERHFELHPVTELYVWDGSSFVLSNYYRSNIKYVADGTAPSTSVLSNLLNGSETMTATVAADDLHVAFTYPSPSYNYVQYDGVTASDIALDALSRYFLFRPGLVPRAIVKCRVVTNTVAAATAANLFSNQSLTVNVLTRTDMLAVSNQIAALSAGQTSTFPRPVEFIVLSITNLGPMSPGILRQPQDQTVIAGSPASFTVEAAGAAPLSFQWQFNGADLPAAPNGVFPLDSGTLDQAGKYSVTVSNFAGSTNSRLAALLVYVSAAANLNGPAYLTNGQFRFGLAGVPGYSYVIQASTNLIQWRSPVQKPRPLSFFATNAIQIPLPFFPVA